MVNQQSRKILLTIIGLMLLTFCAPVDNSPISFQPMSDQKGVTLFPTLATMVMPTVELRPDFIQAVAPKEYRIVPLGLYSYVPEGIAGYGIGAFDLDIPSSLEPGYQSTICVRPLARLLVQEGDDFGSTREKEEKFKERMDLFVDGEMKENDPAYY